MRSLKDYKKDTGKDLRKVAKAKDVAHRMLEAGSAVVTLASCQIRIVRGHREPRRKYRIATKIGRQSDSLVEIPTYLTQEGNRADGSGATSVAVLVMIALAAIIGTRLSRGIPETA